MKINHKGIKIYVQKDYNEMSEKAAQMVAAQMTVKNNSILGLATGSTPEGMYEKLIGMYNSALIDFSEIVSFNLDEYYPLDKENEQSYNVYMKKNLFNYVNIPKENIYIPNGMANDVEKECMQYDRLIQEYNGIDLQILGIGNNGHIGFNEPDVHFEVGTHLVELDEETIQANSRFFESEEHVPKQAISMGMRNIMHSKKIILMASGSGKAQVLKEMLVGPVTPKVPASILQLHNDVTLILDEEAAGKIIEHINFSLVENNLIIIDKGVINSKKRN